MKRFLVSITQKRIRMLFVPVLIINGMLLAAKGMEYANADAIEQFSRDMSLLIKLQGVLLVMWVVMLVVNVWLSESKGKEQE